MISSASLLQSLSIRWDRSDREKVVGAFLVITGSTVRNRSGKDYSGPIYCGRWSSSEDNPIRVHDG